MSSLLPGGMIVKGKWRSSKLEAKVKGWMVSAKNGAKNFNNPFLLARHCTHRLLDGHDALMYIQLKLLFTISVVSDHLLFMTEIPCTDHSVQKSLCGERLPTERYQRPPDFACTEPFTCNCT